MYTSKATQVEVILNDSSGINDRKEDIQIIADIFKSGGIEARISLASGNEITELAKRAARSDAEIIVAGGGDGTISAVAEQIVGTNKTLGVLPLGTFNHFAKDLQIPLDLEDSLQNIIAGNIIQVDVGEVNGHIFINNSGLGFYPAVVKARERQQKKFGHGKFTAFIKAMFRVLSRNLFLHIRLSAEDKEIDTRTSFVFVGNNEYEVESFNFGGRNCLDAGHLSLYMSRKTGRWALIQVALHALTGKLKTTDDLVYICTDEIFIETRRKKLHVAMDGEVFTLKSPLKYIVRPKALRVIAPANKDDE